MLSTLCEYLRVRTVGPDIAETDDIAVDESPVVDDPTPSLGWDRFDSGIAIGVAIATVFVHPVHLILTHAYWLDEAWVAVLTRVSWSRLPGLSLSTPIGFAALLKLVPGSGLQRARLVVLGFSTLAVAMAYVFGRSLPWATRSRARFAGFAAALIVMLAPLSLGRNDLKQYTSDAFCALLVMTVATWVDRAPDRVPVWWLAVASLAALPFSSTSAFVSVAAFGGVLGSALIVGTKRRRIEILVTGAVTAVGLAAYFGALVLPNTNAKLRAYWDAYYLSGSPQHILHASWTRLSKLSGGLGMPAIVFVLLFIAGIVTLTRLRAHAIAIAVPLLGVEMAVIARLREYPFLELRTSHFLLVTSLAVCAIGVVGVVQLGYNRQRVVGAVAAVAFATVFVVSVHTHIGKLNIPAEGARGEAQYVAAHRTPADVILVNSNGAYGFAYYWPHGKVDAIIDQSVGQGFRAQVAGLGALYATGRTDADVLTALRAGLDRWHAAPAGSRLFIVRSHVNAAEKVAWQKAFTELDVHPTPINTYAEKVLVLGPS